MTDQIMPDQGSDTQVTENYLDQLVGEGKKFADIEKLAKGKIDADEHIARVEAEAAELRQKLEERDRKEDHLETIVGLLKPKEEPQVVETPPQTVDQVITEVPKEEPKMSLDIESLRKRESEKLLLERYGNTQNAGEKLRDYISGDSAKEQLVITLMGTDPDALMRILPTDEVQKEMNPTGDTALTGLQPPQLPTTYTEAMRLFEEDKRTYDSAGFQSKLAAAITAAEQAGIDFEKT